MANNFDEDKPLVFVVDDEPDILHLLELCLKNLPINLEMFDSGSPVLERIKKDPRPNLILLDVMMPGISGHDVCRLIREKPEFKNVPIVFLTARTTERDYMGGLHAGGNFYLEKPFDVEKLPNRIFTILSEWKKE